MLRTMIAVWLLAALPLCAQDQMQAMKSRLAEEADAFRRLAPQVLGEERLLQRAQKPPSRFRPRIGNAAKIPPAPVWQERQIVSDYSFGNIGDVLHELRQVISVDGRAVSDPRKAQDALAKAMRDDARKKQLLKEFEKYGLIGAATDFGQLILLFGPRDIGRFQFTPEGPRLSGATRALVFNYRQIDGPQALTLFQANRGDEERRISIQGEVWVKADNFLPLRITLAANYGEGAAETREEATVDYEMSPFGALLPSATGHKELRGGKLVAENTFRYAEFHKFGASSDIKFDVEKK